MSKKQFKEAEKWYSMAYKSGSEDAAFDLGNMYYKLDGYEYAIYWYEKIANLGYLQAQNNLGVCHFKMKDFVRCEKWLKTAADKNLGKACFNLGVLYTFLEKDDEAYEYYKKGSVLLDDDAKYNLAILNGKRKIINQQ
ncbi:TPR repeat family protein [Clostridioides difficile DA00165]|nr:TPR repeat family protein [Clostridioides difficile DA00165]